MVLNVFIFDLAGIYLLKVNNRNNRTKCEICSKLTIKIPERPHWHRSGIFIVNFEHSLHLVLVFLLLTLNMLLPAGEGSHEECDVSHFNQLNLDGSFSIWLRIN